MSYNRKELKVDLGKFVKPNPYKNDIEVNPNGQWDGKGVYRIPSDNITMKNVPYPVWAQPNVGPGMVMQPDQNYNFPGADYVDEYPMAKKGGQKTKYTNNIMATNKVFTKNPLFKKPKRNEVYAPKIKKYQDAGAVTTPVPAPTPVPTEPTIENIIKATLDFERTLPAYKNDRDQEPDYSKMEFVKQVNAPKYLNESITLPYNLGVYKKDNYELVPTPEGYSGLQPVIINGKRFYVNTQKGSLYNKAYEQFVNDYMKVYKRDPMLGKSEYYFRYIEPTKTLQEGGEYAEEFEAELTPEEIQMYIEAGYDVDYLD